MTEKTFEQVIETKHILDNLRKRKKELEDIRDLCPGNTREMRVGTIYVEIPENGYRKKSTIISSQTAKEALECELSDADEKLSKFLNTLSELVQNLGEIQGVKK